jgi:hypothetical protein
MLKYRLFLSEKTYLFDEIPKTQKNWANPILSLSIKSQNYCFVTFDLKQNLNTYLYMIFVKILFIYILYFVSME